MEKTIKDTISKTIKDVIDIKKDVDLCPDFKIDFGIDFEKYLDVKLEADPDLEMNIDIEGLNFLIRFAIQILTDITKTLAELMTYVVAILKALGLPKWIEVIIMVVLALFFCQFRFGVNSNKLLKKQHTKKMAEVPKGTFKVILEFLITFRDNLILVVETMAHTFDDNQKGRYQDLLNQSNYLLDVAKRRLEAQENSNTTFMAVDEISYATVSFMTTRYATEFKQLVDLPATAELPKAERTKFVPSDTTSEKDILEFIAALNNVTIPSFQNLFTTIDSNSRVYYEGNRTTQKEILSILEKIE